jgi:hypothetical protein
MSFAQMSLRANVTKPFFQASENDLTETNALAYHATQLITAASGILLQAWGAKIVPNFL